MWNASTGKSLLCDISFGSSFGILSPSPLIVCDVYHDACTVIRIHTTQQSG
jgi:hypothetical protein